MAPPRKSKRAPLPPSFLAGLLRVVPLEALEPLAWELGYRDPRRTVPSLSKFIATALPLEEAAERLQGLSPANRAVARWVLARIADALAEKPEGAAVLAGGPALRPVPYVGRVVPAPDRQAAALVGSVVWKGEQVSISAPPTVMPRAQGAQLQAAVLRDHLFNLVTSAGEVRAHRAAIERLRAALPTVPRLAHAGEVHAWVQRIWRAAGAVGYRVGLAGPAAQEALAPLTAVPPAELLHRLFATWARDPVADAPAHFELFGASAWRLVAACDQPTPPVVMRILSLAALETLPVDQWVEVAPWVDHLYRSGHLPATCRAINRSYRDPRTVAVTDLRPDHNEGEPFRLRLPTLLRFLCGVPAQLGLLDLALAPPGESAFRFTAPRANLTVCEAPYREVSHVRRTSLGATWLDPLPPPPDAPHGPGADGLDALADLLG